MISTLTALKTYNKTKKLFFLAAIYKLHRLPNQSQISRMIRVIALSRKTIWMSKFWTLTSLVELSPLLRLKWFLKTRRNVI
jgi:hypothetical protein